MGEYFYLKTCRRRFVLEHFDQVPKFFCCNKCDNCLNNNLDDITKEVWDIHNSENKNLFPNKNISLKKDLRFENIKQNLIAQKLIRYATKEKLILINSLSNWIKYVDKRGYTLDNLPDNLRIKIPLQYLYNAKEEDDFDKCEKILNDLTI